MKRLALALICLAPAAHAAPTLSMPPTAMRTAEEATEMGSYALPIGPWANGAIETLKAEGEITQTAWRIREGDITTMAVLSALRDQLRGEGFDVLFECDTDECGGFDLPVRNGCSAGAGHACRSWRFPLPLGTQGRGAGSGLCQPADQSVGRQQFRADDPRGRRPVGAAANFRRALHRARCPAQPGRVGR